MRHIRLPGKVSPGIDAEVLLTVEELRQWLAPGTSATKDGKPVAGEMTWRILMIIG